METMMHTLFNQILLVGPPLLAVCLSIGALKLPPMLLLPLIISFMAGLMLLMTVII
jgi:hypothetical protein